MPPSGYDMTQADAIVAFLASCSKALKQESIQRSETLEQSLDREILGIDRFIANERPSALQESVLKLTGAFYRTVRERMAAHEHFDDAVSAGLAITSADIRKIHVAELA